MNFQQQVFYSIAAMNALFASAAWCAARPTRASIATLVVFAALWPFVNGNLEGHTLVTLSANHGVTTSDLFSIAAIVFAIVQAVKLRRVSRPPRTD